MEAVHVTRAGGVHGRRTRNVRVHVAPIAGAEVTTLDGLAALGSHKEGRDAARALEIMRTPDTGAMGVAAIVLTLLVQFHAEAKLRHVVPRTCFYPPPQVQSAIVSLRRRRMTADLDKEIDAVLSGAKEGSGK